MTFPYNLRKTSRDFDMSQPRIAYPPSSYSSSSSSSCSSSQSSQSPSPVNLTNVNRLDNYVRMPASSVLFSHQLDFEGFSDHDLTDTSNDSDTSGDGLEATNRNNETVIDSNKTIIELERSNANEPFPLTRSKSKNCNGMYFKLMFTLINKDNMHPVIVRLNQTKCECIFLCMYFSEFDFCR